MYALCLVCIIRVFLVSVRFTMMTVGKQQAGVCRGWMVCFAFKLRQQQAAQPKRVRFVISWCRENCYSTCTS